MSRPVALAIVRLAARILPARQRHWGEALAQKVAALPPGEALGFAFSCLACALRQAAVAHLLPSGPLVMPSRLHQHPRLLAALCAVTATALGLLYLNLAGAPLTYSALNLGALVIGFVLAGLAVPPLQGDRVPTGAICLALGAVLLLTSLFGAQADGATRWVGLGGLSIQPSLVVLPMAVMLFAARRDALSTAGVGLAAVALALQPDRGMAGALAAALAVLVLARPERHGLVALAAAAAGFGATLIRPDSLPAVPYVDRLFYTAAEVSPFAAAAVFGGAAVMLLPAVVGLLADPANRERHAAFGAVWLAILAAAALGNYPTPLVGYGGSAIIGYVLSLILLPRQATPTGAQAGATDPAMQQRPGGGDARVVA